MIVLHLNGTRVCLLALAIVPSASADPNPPACSNASLKGRFAFTAAGTTLPALGLPAPLSAPAKLAGNS
jgi:hypothetical protein